MAEFDSTAQKYDFEFTHSPIGKLQRDLVWNYLEKQFSFEGLKILELNCGTGEDALFFSKNGAEILATDKSSEMVRIAAHKTSRFANCEIQQLDLLELEKLKEKRFDLVFSNFGGFNCVSKEDLKKLFVTIQSLLLTNGRFVGVIMPKLCLWEMSYLILKGDRSFLRRNTNQPVEVNLGTNSVSTWYYSPSEVKAITSQQFEMIAKKPIGFFIPPSYLNDYFTDKRNKLNILAKAENVIKDINQISNWSDHYLIDLKKLNPGK